MRKKEKRRIRGRKPRAIESVSSIVDVVFVRRERRCCQERDARRSMSSGSHCSTARRAGSGDGGERRRRRARVGCNSESKSGSQLRQAGTGRAHLVPGGRAEPEQRLQSGQSGERRSGAGLFPHGERERDVRGWLVSRPSSPLAHSLPQSPWHCLFVITATNREQEGADRRSTTAASQRRFGRLASTHRPRGANAMQAWENKESGHFNRASRV
ncbi:hypothetical protein BDZ90DRAFT_183442 [Jaminaea rosea]|uniref:Uncharacterized protein n=1 Tax=Jaminaea rosea TaxID=1569628 RepID=A0A316UP04_9BASI|nr:hypothetical protein BDZ90DRAFT_183442 [Jaminaea rosea]PWN27000.1 hypothetical protein BDZ90DRAFT_183442 [Jaminaea rosea]